MERTEMCDCGNKVMYHLRPAGVETAPVPVTVKTEQDRSSSTVINTLLRLASTLPKWDRTSVCRVFLQRIKQVLVTSGLAEQHWAKILTFVVTDVTMSEWITTHIIMPGLDWSQAEAAFTAHFQLSDHHEVVRLEYLACKQGKNETVQAYADRFVDLATQLGRDHNHEATTERFLDGLTVNIRNKYEQQLVTQRIVNPAFTIEQLDRMIAVCIQLDVANRTAQSRGNATGTGTD